MTNSRLATAVRPLLVLTAFTLLADLFLDWREASVRTPGVAVDAGTSAWGGWGAIAGLTLIAFLVLEVPAMRPLVAAALALLASAFTFVEFFTGEAHVEIADVVSVGTGDALWPAYLGLALAAVLAAGAAIRLAADVPAPGSRPHVPS